MKLCKVCNQEKPYNPDAKRQSKAQGFAGGVCWDCHVRASRLRAQNLNPNNIELDTELQARKAQLRELKAQQAKELLEIRRVAMYAKFAAQERAQEELYQEYQARERAKNTRRLVQQATEAARVKSTIEALKEHGLMSSPK